MLDRRLEMKIKQIISILCTTCIGVMGMPLLSQAEGKPPVVSLSKPNIVFFLVDDLGMMDLACYGSDFHETPHIDQLAREGMRFTNAYATHPVCGPSRASIVTGKFPVRLGLTEIRAKLPPSEVIWPKVLKDQGYTTYFTGKWHMGRAESVKANGFDFNVAGSNVGQPGSFYFPYKADRNGRRAPQQDVPGMEDGKPGDYLTDALTDKALGFLDEHGQQPFLLYFSYYNVHKPFGVHVEGKKEYNAYFQKKLESMPETEPEWQTVNRGGHSIQERLVQNNPEFASQLKTVDDSVGRIMAKLKELGVAENTIVIFTADQGSMCTSKIAVSTSKPYSFGKSFAFEGGIRVPLIMKWPGRIAAGKPNETITISTDLYPTLLDMLGLEKKPKQHLDGISIVDAFDHSVIPFDRTFYWVYPKNHSLGHKASIAVRQGPYKLIYWPESKRKELYNVETDISESEDLARSKPEKVQSMLKLLKNWPYTATYIAE